MPDTTDAPKSEKEIQREKLVRKIAAVSKLAGEFRLRSGQAASRYIDKYQFESDPQILAPLAEWLLELTHDQLPDYLAGLELGGVPLATAMSLASGTPAVFVRKEAKRYGTAKAVEGPSVAGKRVVMVEDVVTTGGQIVESAALLRAAKAEVAVVVCAVWRGESLAALADAGLELRWAMTAQDLGG